MSTARAILRPVIRAARGPALAMLTVTLTAGCSGGNGAHSQATLSEGEDVRLEGRVTEIDRTPMFVDGDGLIYVESERHGAVVVRVPARERRCAAEGLDALSSLSAGDRMRAVGRVTGSGEVTVCADESHVLAKVE